MQAASAAVVGKPRSRVVRVKARFNNPADRCAGIVMNYNNPNDFFVASICRQSSSPAEASCVRVRQYLNGQFYPIVSAQPLPGTFVQLANGVWFELEWTTTTDGTNTFVISLANASPQPLLPAFKVQYANGTAPVEWTSRTDNVVGLWTSFADVSWDDFAVYDFDHTAKVELIYKVCRSCPQQGQGSDAWCKCCFFDCFVPQLGRGEKAKCIADGFCTSKPCTNTNYCMPTPMPPATPAPPTPAPAPTTAPPTPAPPAAPRPMPYAATCSDASRFLNPDPTAGSLCLSCNKYALSGNSSDNCHWCDDIGGYSICVKASDTALYCSNAKRIIRTEAECPNPCTPAPVPQRCAIPAGSTVATSSQCTIMNSNYTDTCYNQATIDGPRCIAAVRRYDCTRECQQCQPDVASSTRAFLLQPCTSACDDIMTSCTTTSARNACGSARKCSAGLCAKTVPLVGETPAPTPVPVTDPNNPCAQDQDRDLIPDCDDTDLTLASITGAGYLPLWDGSVAALVEFGSTAGLLTAGATRLRVRAASATTAFSTSYDIDALDGASRLVTVRGLSIAQQLTVCVRPTVSPLGAVANGCLAVFNTSTSAFECVSTSALSIGTGRANGTVCGKTTHLSRFAIAEMPSTTTVTTTSTTAESTTSTPITTTPAPSPDSSSSGGDGSSTSNGGDGSSTTTMDGGSTVPGSTGDGTTSPGDTTSGAADTTGGTNVGVSTSDTLALMSPSGLSEGGLIAIIVVFSLLGVILLALLIWFLVRRSSRGKKKGDDLGSREMTDKVVPKDDGATKVIDDSDDDESDEKPKAKADDTKKAAAAAAAAKKTEEPKKAAEPKKEEPKKTTPVEEPKKTTKKVAVAEESESSEKDDDESEYSYEEDEEFEGEVKPPPSRKPPAPEPTDKKEAAPALPSSPSPAAAGVDSSSESDLFDETEDESGSDVSGSYSESQ
jgi:outer membrane biosynthesis protein TonB